MTGDDDNDDRGKVLMNRMNIANNKIIVGNNLLLYYSPMDILGKSHRFSYAAAWGSIAFLATDMVFGSTAIVNLQGPSYVTGR